MIASTRSAFVRHPLVPASAVNFPLARDPFVVLVFAYSTRFPPMVCFFHSFSAFSCFQRTNHLYIL